MDRARADRAPGGHLPAVRRPTRQARAGNLAPPFAHAQLSAENLRAVRDFSGEPAQVLDAQARRFLRAAAAGSAGDLIGRQRGPVPVGLQAMWGPSELAVHHDDAVAAAGRGYRPPEQVVAVLAAMKAAVDGLPGGDDSWLAILQSTGRRLRKAPTGSGDTIGRDRAPASERSS